MSVKLLYCVVLLALVSVSSGSSSSRREHARPGLRERLARIEPENTITLASFTWSDSAEQILENKTVTICGDIDISSGLGEAIEYTFLYGKSEGENEVNAVGSGDEGDPMCAIFAMDIYLPMPKDEEEYELYVTGTTDETYNHGKASFIMDIPEGAVIVTDNWMGGPLYRVVGSFETGCIDTEMANVCYTNDTSNIDGGETCNTVPTDSTEIQICVTEVSAGDGTTLTTDTLTINSLTYGSEESPITAQLSLDLAGDPVPATLEAVVAYGLDVAYVYGCASLDLCSLTNFTVSSDTYNVLTVGLDGTGVPLNAGQNTITDLNIRVFEDSPMIEFGFTKTDSSNIYHAFFNTNLDGPTTSIDCTAIAAGHTCFGFLEHELEDESVEVAIEYDGDNTNTVIAPYTIPKPEQQ